MNDLLKRLTSTAEKARLLQQERTILEITEAVCELLAQQGVSRAELARRIGKSRSQISQWLNGDANMTVRTMSDLFFALGKSIRAELFDLHRDESYWSPPESIKWRLGQRSFDPWKLKDPALQAEIGEHPSAGLVA